MLSKILVSSLTRSLALINERKLLHTLLTKQSNHWNINRQLQNKKTVLYNRIDKKYESTGEPPKKKSLVLLSWKSVAISFIFGGALLILLNKLKKEKQESQKRQRKQQIGKMAIGGPFELLDQNGKTVKNTDFLGSWMLLYFGFTHCPDICPEEMDKMCEAVDLVEKVEIKGAKLVPLFITVDPDRDDVAAVNKYLKDFSPKLRGLTGSKKQIEQVTKAYRVYFSNGPKDEDNDYIVDHTVIMYLIDPEGNFVDYFGQNKKAAEVATAVAIHMGTYEHGANAKTQ